MLSFVLLTSVESGKVLASVSEKMYEGLPSTKKPISPNVSVKHPLPSFTMSRPFHAPPAVFSKKRSQIMQIPLEYTE